MLQVKDLHKAFGRKQVVKGIDFSMSTGEVLGLL
ncbi:MAG: lipopolysaccharide ABC transporter ATP-binding protein, partial [Treponema sp.]|nr:lipopolysaccharide ABC transporter ATP-binding protein [Treponema sp.]